MLNERKEGSYIGLDQYLRASKYVGAWEHSKDGERKKYNRITKAIGLDDWRCEDSPSLTVNVNVAYWRKANQIHAWFVRNVQEGEDDCGNYYVSREQLVELRDICERIMKSTKLVKGTVKNGEIITAAGRTKCLEEGKVMQDTSLAKELLPPQEGFFFGGTDFDQWYWEDLERTVKQINMVLDKFDGWDFEYHSSW